MGACCPARHARCTAWVRTAWVRTAAAAAALQLLVVDEAHHAPADSYLKVMDSVLSSWDGMDTAGSDSEGTAGTASRDPAGAASAGDGMIDAVCSPGGGGSSLGSSSRGCGHSSSGSGDEVEEEVEGEEEEEEAAALRSLASAGCLLVGCTATPVRMDKKSLADVFEVKGAVLARVFRGEGGCHGTCQLGGSAWGGQ